MPRDAPDSMMTRPVGERSSERTSRSSIAAMSEQALVDAAVVDDVLAGHEPAPGAAEEGDEVAALLRIGEATRRATAQAVLDDRLVGRVLPLGMGMEVGPQRVGIEEPG